MLAYLTYSSCRQSCELGQLLFTGKDLAVTMSTGDALCSSPFGKSGLQRVRPGGRRQAEDGSAMCEDAHEKCSVTYQTGARREAALSRQASCTTVTRLELLGALTVHPKPTLLAGTFSHRGDGIEGAAHQQDSNLPPTAHCPLDCFTVTIDLPALRHRDQPEWCRHPERSPWQRVEWSSPSWALAGCLPSDSTLVPDILFSTEPWRGRQRRHCRTSSPALRGFLQSLDAQADTQCPGSLCPSADIAEQC